MPPFSDRTSASRRGIALRAFLVAASGFFLFLAASPAWSQKLLTTTKAADSPSQTTASSGCCGSPDVLNYGIHLDFSQWEQGTEITNQFRPLGLLVGRGAAPRADQALVAYDYSRPLGCRPVLSAGPANQFSGWEFFAFVDSVQNRWSKVQRIGASVGYCDQVHSCFIAAYDGQGNLLEAKFNEQIGFQFLSIERPTPDINCVLVGDCPGQSSTCYPDPAGSALNCLSFSTPIATTAALPDTIIVPGAPITVGAPSSSTSGLVALALALAAIGLRSMRRKKVVQV